MKTYVDFSENGNAPLTVTASKWNFSLTGEMADYVRKHMDENGVILQDVIDSFLDNEVKTFELLKKSLNTKIASVIIDDAIEKMFATEFSGKAITMSELQTVNSRTIRKFVQKYRDHEKGINFIPSTIDTPKAAIRLETLAIWFETLVHLHDADARFRDTFKLKREIMITLYAETLALI